MRVSERHRYNLAEKRMENAKSNNANVLEELSTQKRIREISDDPIGMARSIRYRDRIAETDQFVKNVDYSRGFIARSEAAINDINENLMRVKELAIAAASDTYNASSREASGLEVNQIMNAVVQAGNSQYNGRFVFSGFRSTSPALSVEGDYLGDDGAIFIEIGAGDFKQVNLQSRNLFEASIEEREVGRMNMVQALDTVYDGMMRNDKFQIQKGLNELDFHLDKTTSYQASLGALSSTFEQTMARTEKDRDFTKAALSSVEDSDIFHASSEFKRTETIMQSTMLATNKMLQPNLLNFMQ